MKLDSPGRLRLSPSSETPEKIAAARAGLGRGKTDPRRHRHRQVVAEPSFDRLRRRFGLPFANQQLRQGNERAFLRLRRGDGQGLAVNPHRFGRMTVDGHRPVPIAPASKTHSALPKRN